MGLVSLSMLSLASGLILKSVTRGRKEFKRLAYLAIPRIGDASVTYSNNSAVAESFPPR